MVTGPSEDPLRSEANHQLPKAPGAAFPLGGLVRLLARQAAREVIASGLDEARAAMSPGLSRPPQRNRTDRMTEKGGRGPIDHDKG